jgi:membrane protein DedA with SNARE-associated domain
MAKNVTRSWFTRAVLLAFPGVVLLFNTNSYFADKHKINGLFVVLGIVLCLGAGYCLWQANKYGNPKKH